MINNEDDISQIPEKKNDNFVDSAKMDTQCHILIKDSDTGEILVNKRG